jgi:hypothetical protein
MMYQAVNPKDMQKHMKPNAAIAVNCPAEYHPRNNLLHKNMFANILIIFDKQSIITVNRNNLYLIFCFPWKVSEDADRDQRRKLRI